MTLVFEIFSSSGVDISDKRRVLATSKAAGLLIDFWWRGVAGGIGVLCLRNMWVEQEDARYDITFDTHAALAKELIVLALFKK